MTAAVEWPMALRKNARVQMADDPSLGEGTVWTKRGQEALVFWDGDYDAESGEWTSGDDPERDRWYPVSSLREVASDGGEYVESGAGAVGVPLIYAPKIQDLEFATRKHPVTHTLVMERSQAYRGGPGPVIADSETIYELWKHMSELDGEHIVVALLDVRNNLLGWKPVHKGKLASVEADIKDIIKDAILMNAAKIVILHNHPSGDPGPSEADAELTQALSDLAGEMSIELHDHVIVGQDNYYSFRDEGLIQEPESE